MAPRLSDVNDVADGEPYQIPWGTGGAGQPPVNIHGYDAAILIDVCKAPTRLDSSWFEAQYNCGVLAFDLQDYPRALTADEMALAIQPRSSNARYNFALALKASGYVTDAEIELKKVVAADPDNVRAHLALGNLYEFQFRS